MNYSQHMHGNTFFDNYKETQFCHKTNPPRPAIIILYNLLDPGFSTGEPYNHSKKYLFFQNTASICVVTVPSSHPQRNRYHCTLQSLNRLQTWQLAHSILQVVADTESRGRERKY
jgi:hypothetical protein